MRISINKSKAIFSNVSLLGKKRVCFEPAKEKGSFFRQKSAKREVFLYPENTDVISVSGGAGVQDFRIWGGSDSGHC